MRFLVAGSGSSGNALLLETARTRILVDAGVGPRALVAKLRTLGVDLFPRSVDAILPSHVHNDHFAHAEPLGKATHARFLLHRGLRAPRVRDRFHTEHLDTDSAVYVGDILVECCAVPHDADQIAFRLTGDGVTIGIATDLGHVPSRLRTFFGACDALFLEANHDPELLRASSYPPVLRRRIEGPLGHLSNDQVADALAGLRGSAVRSVYLAHLSRGNNSEELALGAARAARPDLDVHVVSHGTPCELALPPRLARAKSPRFTPPVQLCLPL